VPADGAGPEERDDLFPGGIGEESVRQLWDFIGLFLG
jgi:hypothetical protein